MTQIAESLTRGHVVRVADGVVIFKPNGTNYEHHLVSTSTSVPTDRPINVVMRVTARKVYSMSAGGAFVAPILGTPRTLQGRVQWLDARTMVVRAGGMFVVELPTGTDTVDLANGEISVGSMVNVVAMPGASVELAT